MVARSAGEHARSTAGGTRERESERDEREKAGARASEHTRCTQGRPLRGLSHLWLHAAPQLSTLPYARRLQYARDSVLAAVSVGSVEVVLRSILRHCRGGMGRGEDGEREGGALQKVSRELLEPAER